MSTIVEVILNIYRFMQVLWNAYLVLLQVIRSVLAEAQQEARELMAMLDSKHPVMSAMRMTVTEGGPASLCQMLVISRKSSFVLLLRLSKTRVLHLEVDEAFIAFKLEVIKTDLLVNIQHVPRMLDLPIGTHDTRLVKYTPTPVPYVWQERCEGVEGVEGAGAVAVTATVSATSPTGERGHRKKYVQLLMEGALRRRRLRLEHAKEEIESGPKTSMEEEVKTGDSKRRALADITIGNVVEDKDCEDKPAGECPTPKQVRMERHIRTALLENLSIGNLVQAASQRKSLDGVHQPRKMTVVPPRRKRELYSRSSIGSFSLVNNTTTGED